MTPEELRDLYGDVSPLAAVKVIHRFDPHCRQFIAQSPFVIIATSDGKDLDLSPKGDPIGFVEVESDTSLLIPDRPGNNRIDGLLNILAHPQVAVLFMIPTVDETLRVTGKAEIIADPSLCERFAIKGRAPRTVTRITVDEIFTHCGKAPLRAGLWKPDSWPETRPVPTLYEMIRDHAEQPIEHTDQDSVEARYRQTLY